jgi:hypothetical protein
MVTQGSKAARGSNINVLPVAVFVFMFEADGAGSRHASSSISKSVDHSPVAAKAAQANKSASHG